MLRRFLSIFNSWPLFLIFGVVFRVVLELGYRDFVFPLYEYAGFVMKHSSEKYVESWVLYVGMLLFLPSSVRKPSDLLIYLAFFFFIAPLLVFYGFANSERWVLYCVLLQYVTMSLFRFGRPISVPTFKNGPKIAVAIAIAGIVAATSWMVLSVGFTTFNLNFSAVYEYRAVANTAIYSGTIGYVVVWATTVFGPFMLMLALRDKRYFLALCLIALSVFWFGVSSHKAVLFYPVFVVSLYVFFKYSRSLSLVSLGLSLVLIGALINFYLTGDLQLSSLFIRRVFFVPPFLAVTYFDFFDGHALVYWSNSFLSSLIQYPYQEDVAMIIGSRLPAPAAWANSSFFSTGYMHAGVYGAILYGLVSGLTLKILDSLMQNNVPLWMSLTVVIVPYFNLFTSSDLPTTLLTHGLGIGILLLYLMGRSTGGSLQRRMLSTEESVLEQSFDEKGGAT